MTNQNSRRTALIWLSVLILFICVAATTIAVMSRLDTFLLSDEGAIPLINDTPETTDVITTSIVTTEAVGNSAPQPPVSESEKAPDTVVGGETEPPADLDYQTLPPNVNPGFEVSDEQTVWSTYTQVEIFKVSYENGEKVITVQSHNGDKVIAPGTENSYTFKLKNTGNAAVDYILEVDAYFTPADIYIPVTGRLSRYDGKWIVGSGESYASVPVLDAAEDKGTLGMGKYTYYTLDWLWPFESGNDEYDTMLGNLATEQDLTFTIVIRTIAMLSDDPNSDGGITAPQTGDNTATAILVTVAVSSFAMMMFLLFSRNKEKGRHDAEA